MRRTLTFALAALVSLLPAAADAQRHKAITNEELTQAGMPKQCQAFAKAVSATEGGWNSTKNPTGPKDTRYCYGAFQFCTARHSRTGFTFSQYNPGWTPEAFLASPTQQVNAWTRYQQDRWQDIQRNPQLRGLIGKQACYGGSCFTIDQGALLKAAQFGTGRGSAMEKFAQTGSCAHGDGYNTSVCKYMKQGAGYDVSCFTGQKTQPQDQLVCGPSQPPGPNMPKGDYPNPPIGGVTGAAAGQLASIAPSPQPTDINVGSGLAMLERPETFLQ